MVETVFGKMFSGSGGNHCSFSELDFFTMIFGNYTNSDFNTFLMTNRTLIHGNRNITHDEAREEFIKINSNRLMGIAFSYSFWVEQFNNPDIEIGDLFNSEVSWYVIEKIFTTPLIKHCIVGKRYNECGSDFILANQDKDLTLRKNLILNVSKDISYYREIAKNTIKNNYNNIDDIFMCPLSKKYFQLPDEDDTTTIISLIRGSK